MRNRTLSLKKETLAELASDDLRAVAGASAGPTCYSCLTACGICEESALCAGYEPITGFVFCPGIALTRRCV